MAAQRGRDWRLDASPRVGLCRPPGVGARAGAGSARVQALLVALLSVSILTWASPGRALDTLETYEPGGLTHFEPRVRYQGIGRGRAERTLSVLSLLGVGINDWFSGYYYVRGDKLDEYFSDGETAHGFGGFASPLDTYHFDLDLELGLDLASSGDLLVTPGFELNVDAHPDLSSFGLFLIGTAQFGGHSGSEDGAVGARHTLCLGLDIGAYVTFAARHQLLVQYDTSVPVNPEAGERDMEVGGLALGYNVKVHDQIELIHEVLLDIPQDQEAVGIGLMAGLIARTF
jgi:hypothetical protein